MTLPGLRHADSSVISLARRLQYLSHFPLVLLAMFSINIAQANDRLALVIGNADYDLRPLENPANDASAMKQRLEELGFKVIFRANADQGVLQEAVRQFLTEAPRHKVRVVYYSGHGAQVNETNYLLPVSPRIEYLEDLQRFGTSLNAVIDHLRGDSSKLNIVVLDACRDNPYLTRPSRSKGRSRGMAGSGLASMYAGSGTLIAYATAPGKLAYDGVGPFSPFTRRLLEYLGSPGLPLPLLFQQVTEEVHRDTSGKQSPWLTQSLVGGHFCFRSDNQGRCGNTDAVREVNTVVAKLGRSRSAGDGGRTIGLYDQVLRTAEGLNQDDLEEWLARAEGGEPYSQTVLGRYFELHERPNAPANAGHAPEVEWLKPKMLYWYQQAAKQGYPAAQVLLGQVYLTGSGLGGQGHASRELAKHWFDQANAQPYAIAQYGLAARAASPREAFNLYLAAAETGHEPAMIDVAAAYLIGRGTSVDTNAASLWARRALVNREIGALDDPATQILVHLHRCRTLQPISKEEGIELDALERELAKRQTANAEGFSHVPAACQPTLDPISSH